MPSMFRLAVLAWFSEDELKNLARKLERKLPAHKNGLAEKREERQTQAHDLTNSGVRLGAETTILVVSLYAVGPTFGLSLFATVGSLGFLLWDGMKLARKAGGWRKTSRQADDLDEEITEIEGILKGIAEELARRP